MTARQLRRAAERKAVKEARKAERAGTQTPAMDLDGAPEPVENQNRSTGPRTEAGKAISSLNNLQHGLTGAFRVLQSENQEEFEGIRTALHDEHQPETATELILVDKMAQHAWLSARAQRLQDTALENEDEKRFALFLRYQTTNDRAFSKCLNDLQKLRRGAESHAAGVRLANARAAHLELDTDVRGMIEAPMPGNTPIPFDRLKSVLRTSLRQVAEDLNPELSQRRTANFRNSCPIPAA